VNERFVVIGGGTMGVGIAYVAANAGFRVDIVESNRVRAGRIHDALAKQWRRAVGRGKLTETAAEAGVSRVVVGADLDAVAPRPDVVVEAVPEQLALKKTVLCAAERLEPALLGSNTSSISIAALAEGLTGPEKLVGLHFFNPVWAMPLLEIVVGPATTEQTSASAVALAARLGKDAILVRDAPGFATSRLGVALGLEAMRMLADGVASAEDIDKAMMLGYRHPMGPLELTDVVGLDVRLAVARTLQQAYGDRFAPPPLLERMVAEGKLGRKVGEGFYRWGDGVRSTTR
jgi:3-hydroxybutyryl-CoA dehydrogenase